ncbi:MAG TPA: leucyl aminopeptidase [Gammaproteobacteria bacterium]|nr:leucyl aminopeptidase [Gammaproteobacteria bacterium]
MKIEIKSSSPVKLSGNCLVVPMLKNNRLTSIAAQVNDASDGLLHQLAKKSGFKGKVGTTSVFHNLPGIKAVRVMLVGIGNKKEINGKITREVIEAVMKRLHQENCTNAMITLPFEETAAEMHYSLIRETALYAENAVYCFEECKSKPSKQTLVDKITLITGGIDNQYAKKAMAHGKAIADGMKLARDLSNLPGNICTPTYLAGKAQKLARKYTKFSSKILNEKEMQKLKMGALLSVSRGSRQPAKLIIMEHKGGKNDQQPVVLVGKGLTFDAGGISLKPPGKMDEMKYDMCGSASVFGALQACAELKLPLNVIGIIPSSENLPDGDANKPGDIVTSMAGLTIEVLNTDAEGRLILCDALTYAERYNPAVVIDIATLTGACIVALGHHTSGLMANNHKLADELIEAGNQANDKAWQLPLGDEYQKQLKSNFADIANIGGPAAGSITAGCFLSRFTEDYTWAHLDIAGTAWQSGHNKGATGRPVPLLVNYLLNKARLCP